MSERGERTNTRGPAYRRNGHVIGHALILAHGGIRPAGRGGRGGRRPLPSREDQLYQQQTQLVEADHRGGDQEIGNRVPIRRDEQRQDP